VWIFILAFHNRLPWGQGEELKKLIVKGGSETSTECGLEKNFYSTVFLVSKKDGQLRPIINLNSLNKLLKPQHFNMEGMRVV